jgi:hypothetical protein
MKEFRVPSISSVFVVGSLWWGGITAASVAAGQPVVAVLALACTVAQLWGAFKFAGSAGEAELLSSVSAIPEQRLVVSERGTKAA